MSQIPAAILWESYTWVSARWFSASPCCTISEWCGVGSLSPRRLAQRSVHPGNLPVAARTIPWLAAVLRPYSSACALTMRQVSCVWGSCNTTRRAECSASGRTLGGRDTRQHLSWRFYSSVFSFRWFCREQARFAGDKAKCVFRYGMQCGNHCGSSGPDRALEFLQSFLPKGPCLQFFSSFRVLLVCKVEPEKSLLHFSVSCIFSHSCPQDRTIIRLLGQGLCCCHRPGKAEAGRTGPPKQPTGDCSLGYGSECANLGADRSADRKGVCIPRQPH